MRIFFLITTLLLTTSLLGQQTKVYGKVFDAATKQPIDFVKVGFHDSDVAVFTHEDGSYELETYFASDTLVVTSFGYKSVRQKIQLDKSQEVNIYLTISEEEIEGVVIRFDGLPPAMRIMQKVIRNKRINNKEKLEAYEYELYNKVQVDLNNLGETFKDGSLVKKLDFVLDYLDSNDKEGKLLPILLAESVSDFYFKKNPLHKAEIIKADRVSGLENLQINQILGDIFLDFNIYDNNVNLFQRSFISPISNFGKNYYNYSLIDSAYIDNQFFFKINFTPKRSGETTFEGYMWIHDTTFAVKEFKADLSTVANINYINGMYIEHYFEQVEKEVWMLTEEKLIVDLNIAKDSQLPGFFIRRSSSRYNYKINEKYPDNFFLRRDAVERQKEAANRSDHYWDSIRRTPLTVKEENIDRMIDSLNKTPIFNLYKNVIYLAATGYYPVGKYLELGDLYGFTSTNPVEQIRFGVALRTSNNFSKIVELGGRIGYGIRDRRIKWGGLTKVNLSQKRFGVLSVYADYEVEQYGAGTKAGSTFANLLKTAPFDKLFYETRGGFNIEKDVGKDFIFYVSAETKQLQSAGLAKFERLLNNHQLDNINTLKTTEFSFGFSWGKERQYIVAIFSRALIGSKFPVLSINGTFGVKGILGSQYNYQNVTLNLDHTTNVGILGRLSYGLSSGKYFGTVPYPFLKIHEGAQSYWFLKNAFNKMSYFEFISDTYVNGYLEHHFQGLLFNRIPLLKKLKWREIIHARTAWGTISNRQNEAMLLPEFTKEFGKTPYIEFGFGIENIFKFFRVDFVYRATHQIQGTKPYGVRVRFDIII